MLKPLHIIHRALPDLQSGYTLRSQGLLKAQLEIGMNPTAFISPECPIHSIDRELLPCGVLKYEFDSVDYLGCPDYSSGTRKNWLLLSGFTRSLGIPGLARVAGRYRVAPATEKKILEYICDEIDADIIHCHTPSICFDFAKRIRQQTKKPILYEVRGFWNLSAEAEDIGSSAWRKRQNNAEMDAINAADHVSTLGGPMKSYLIEQGVRPDKIDLLPNGVDSIETFSKDLRQQVRKSLGYNSDEFVCGCFSNIRKLEGLEVALRAIRLLRSKGTNVKFLLVGSGSELLKLQQLVSELEIEDQVRFHGRVDKSEILNLYSALDAFLIPRINKPVGRIVSPVKILEPMAVGVPLIVSRLDALVEYTGSDRGFTFEPDNPQSLGEIIQFLISNPDKALSTANQARNWIEQNRSWEKIALESKLIYEKMVSSNAN